jgi:hypothetical protein
MEIRNEEIEEIRCSKTAVQCIDPEKTEYEPECREKGTTKTIVLSVILILTLLLACFLLRTERIYLSPNDEYRVIHLFGTNLFFHNTGARIPMFNLIDTEKDDISKINIFASCKKKYALLVYSKGVKIYDHGQHVSGYENDSMMATVSSCVADYDGNGNDDIFLLLKKEDEKYGERLIVLNYNDEKVEKTYDASFKKVNPWKVQVCDVDGDGEKEVSLAVYTVAKYHPVSAKRPFIYNFHDNKLYPKWLGSRLSRPFDDYVFCDVDGDKKDELISVETTKEGKKELDVYKWKGFGFESVGVSKAYDQMDDIKADGKLITVVCGNKFSKELEAFEYRNGKIETGG